MKRGFVWFLAGLLIVSGASLARLCRAEEAEIIALPVEDEVTARITDLNTETSMLSLQVYTDEEMSIYEVEDMFVPKEAVIEDEGQKIELKDLTPYELITVKYKLAADGKKEVEHIWVKHNTL